MENNEERYDIALKPVYTTESANKSIILYSGYITIIHKDGNKITGNGEIRYTWLPSPKISFIVNDVHTSTGSEDSYYLLVEEIGIKYPCFITNCVFGSRGMYIEGFVNKNILVGSGQECEYIICQIANFPEHFGSVIKERSRNSFRRGRMLIECRDVEIIIESVPKKSSLLKEFRVNTGYVFTDTLRIMHRNNQRISYEDYRKMTSALYHFLSFCAGSWSSSLFATGFVGEDKLWQEWSPSNVNTWTNRMNWFPRNEEIELGCIFDGINDMLSNDIWRKSIVSVVYWYIESNLSSSGVEGSIILSTAAIELVAWIYLVQDKKVISVNEFKNKDFNNTVKFKELFTHMGIPFDKGVESKDGKPWGEGDTCSFLVKLRNDIVHPPIRPSKRSIVDIPFEDREMGYRLSCWYLELCILRLCNYTGMYFNRLTYQVERVPWHVE